MTEDHWSPGDVAVRREWLHGHVWLGFATYVVEDSDDLLAVYLAEGSELAFPDWPFEQWVHPWFEAGHRAWHGHGKLMLHRAERRYSTEQAVSIRATGAQVAEMLSSGSHWWDETWAEWVPPSHWESLPLPEGWDRPEGARA